jgi:hypothetical protein
VTIQAIDEIDWQRPWLSALRALAQPVLQSGDWKAGLNAAAVSQQLHNHRRLPLHFVPQAALPDEQAYEAFISATGGVPTRDNLHDFFNALVWLRFPQIKIQLNALQSAEIAKSGTVRRGSMRDAATIFDENAALFVTSDRSIADLLQQHQWRQLFIDRRAVFGHEYDVYLFGHALMEKLVRPYKAITAHAWIVHVDQAFFTLPLEERCKSIDAIVSNQIHNGLATADFTPLPVLGVPSWWAQQEDAFYDDVSVFRPKRIRKQATPSG